MAKSVLSADHFQDEDAAFAYVEAALWPEGPVCPFCGNCDQTKIGRLNGKTTRPGLRKCYACKQPFTVRIGTIFEGSHLALHLWLQVIHLMCASKKGISTRQIQRMLQCSMKTAWHLTHRIREAMAPGETGPMGGEGEIIEADETEITLSRKSRPRARKDNPKVLALVQRGGPVRTFHLDSNREVKGMIREHVRPETTLHTDKAPYYKGLVENHESVDHSKYEWARGDVTTNRAEGYFSIFKRGMVGVYQHCDDKHLHRYLAEFDFRMNHRERLGVNDTERANIAVKGAKGKRLTYRTTGGQEQKEVPF
jgi:transposase-like protein